MLMKDRLSRPSLAQQYPLPRESSNISPIASLAFPSESSDQDFVLGSNVSIENYLQLLPNSDSVAQSTTGFRLHSCRRDVLLFAMCQQRVARGHKFTSSLLHSTAGRDADAIAVSSPTALFSDSGR